MLLCSASAAARKRSISACESRSEGLVLADDIKTATGMIVQAQRDSLDHLVVALARRKNGAVRETIGVGPPGRFTVSRKWRTAYHYVSSQFLDGKPLTLSWNCSGAHPMLGARCRLMLLLKFADRRRSRAVKSLKPMNCRWPQLFHEEWPAARGDSTGPRHRLARARV